MRSAAPRYLWLLAMPLFLLTPHRAESDDDFSIGPNFSRERLVAWCIVPFDARKRGPAARAEMLKGLGLNRVAYDWRPEHVGTFEDEVQQYSKHGIEFFAFWSWHDSLEALIRRYDVHPQIWITNPSPQGASDAERVVNAARHLLPQVKKTGSLNCKLGLYNHGGWGGQPDNLVAVCQHLRQQHDADHVGIVYNFHHAHDQIAGFAQSLEAMKPYLLCLNLNGMVQLSGPQGAKNKILPLGHGDYEAEMIKIVIESGYAGPIGILDHRNDTDAQKSLQLNLDGLAEILKEFSNDGTQSGPKR